MNIFKRIAKKAVTSLINQQGNMLRVSICTVIAALSCHAAEPSNTGPLHPRVLADFEEDGTELVWQGLRCERTDQRASSGRFSLRFTVPRWTESEEPRPGIRLPLASIQADPDFSGFSKISVDVWVDGEQPGKLGLKLRDRNDESSWTTHINVEPHRWNRADLLLRDAAADCDVRHVKEVVLYALRPTNTFTLVVDNLRLEPKEAPALADFHLRRPNYRGWIFPDCRAAEVDIVVAAKACGYTPGDLRLRLDLLGGSRSRKVEQPLRAETNHIVISTKDLSPGPITLTATVRTKAQVLAARTWPLRLLTRQDVAGLKGYIDADNRLIVQGKPFFPLGWYGSVNESHLAEIADSPFNCLLAYGTDSVPKDRMVRFLDLMHSKGLKLVYCMNDVYPTATYLEGKDWEGIRGNDAIAAAIVAAYRDHPALLAWYLNDELPHALVPQLEDYYRRVQTGDPSHPCFIVLCNRHEFPYFPQTTDILGVDPYPIPKESVTRVSSFVIQAQEAVRRTQPVWLVPQAFAWYQYNSKNPDRGHTPTAEELRTGRAPTYEEERCMTYLGLVHGAKGLIYYCYYDLRVLPQYQEMWGWMKSIANEVKTLAPALLSTEPPGPWSITSPNSPIHASLLLHEKTLYLLAVNPTGEACRAEFDIRHRSAKDVQVLFENRRLSCANGHFEDDFPPLAVHVYTLRK